MPEFVIPGDIAHVIQIAIAPVFLLAGIGAFLNVMTNRLGRVVDRWRTLEGELSGCDEDRRRLHVKELGILDRRMAHSNRAIALSTLAALLVCVVIIFLFTGQLLQASVTRAVSILFIAAMSVLVTALLSFLLEIRISSRTLRVAGHLIKPRD
ncbi:DUF2721 domain-containing protein [uncultured Hyphomonas sp.]|uniref:DUF2721 domain-containing protein n=1 Tax=uncultured Hyphomonas sp. TaxID=225298 RepID=UPI002AAB4C84|nr:DUF2721 domain-containing protein [uncultured Hyphomonas sp.]